ncbi:MAG TPA: fibronectin type III-like domain-contianing protein, partial [Polyangia bacterium]
MTNTGDRRGTTVAQCYVRLTGTSVARPVRELKGFQRVDLAPLETKTLGFTLTKAELAFWNMDGKNLVESAALDVWIAPDSTSG